ncbi:MAG: sodium:solute symporter family protein [Gammaproteobacteria bacterium]|nr:sodium:solute symporter family protein [Gammaproteobacteria bacterium]MDH5583876.1 sodium:solute symporter family protein [Gammaproteobacteria bacterium]
MNIYTVTIFISILVYVAVGNYAGRKVKNLEDYFVVGRQAPTLLIVGTLVASFLSTNTFLGDAGFIYGFNTGRLLIPALFLVGYIYGAIYFGRYLRRSRSLTVAGYFADRFNSRRVQVVAGITVVVGIGFYLIAVTQGVALILSNLTALSYTQALVLAWASYTSFTLYSGSRGVVLTDTMMFLLFSLVSFLAMFSIFETHGGWVAAMEGLTQLESKPNLMAWHGMSGPGEIWQTPADFLIWYLIISVGWSFVAAVSPWQSSRYLMAKNEQVVLRSAAVAAISIAVVQMVVFMAASMVNLSNEAIEPREDVLIWASTNILTPMVGALVLAGLVAAGLSSASTFLSLAGFNFSNDIFQLKSTEDKARLKFSRTMMLLVGVIALVVCLSIEQHIFWLTYFGATLFASAWGPVALMSVWSSRITASAAFWGIVSGFLGNTIPKLLSTMGLIVLPVYLDPILMGGIISLVVVLVVSGNTRVTDIERRNRLALLDIPAEELDATEARKTLYYAYALGVFGVAITLGMLRFYVLPYQQAVFADGREFRFDWFSGEAMFAYCWAIIFCFLAWVMRRAIHSYYLPKKTKAALMPNEAKAQ